MKNDIFLGKKDCCFSRREKKGKVCVYSWVYAKEISVGAKGKRLSCKGSSHIFSHFGLSIHIKDARCVL